MCAGLCAGGSDCAGAESQEGGLLKGSANMVRLAGVVLRVSVCACMCARARACLFLLTACVIVYLNRVVLCKYIFFSLFVIARLFYI